MTKLVVRFLDGNGQMLGWTQVHAHMPGDGKLWCDGLVVTPFASGQCVTMSIHWCDVNTEIRVPCSHIMTQGVPVTLYAGPTPLIIVGPMPTGLVPVTVGSQAITVPLGSLGARGLG